MRASIVAAARGIVAALCLSFAVSAGAQAPANPSSQPAATAPSQPPVSRPESTYGADAEVTAQQQQQIVQPLNNKPVWDIVRSGQPQFTSLPGRETNVLIQPKGQTWRALRNGQLSFWGGWGIVLIIIVITAWHLYRGMIPLHGPRTGHLIRRFTLWERVIHWIAAVSWVILAISGLIILFGKNGLLPLVGYTVFSWLAMLSKNLHNFTGPVFVITTVLVFLTFVRDNLWRAYDWQWVRRFGGMLSGHEVPAGKYNAGEKIWFWLGVLLLGVVVSASGLVLDFPNFDQTRATMQIANVVHLVAASLFIMMGLGHIYIGTLGMEGAYDAMRTGYVDETWAREHHEYWYNDIKAGRIPPSGDVIPPTLARPA